MTPKNNKYKKEMTLEEKIEGALDIFHNYWHEHPLEPHWHRAIIPLMELYEEIKRKKRGIIKRKKRGMIVSWPKIGQEVQDIFFGNIGTVVSTYVEKNAKYVRVDWGLFEKDVSVNGLKKVDS